MWSKYKEPGIAAGILAAFVLVLYSPYLFSGELLLARDQLPGYGGWTYFRELLRQGIFPFWSDGHLAGMPSFDGLPGDAFYPPFLLGLFILPMTVLHAFLFISHTFLAGGLAYYFARRRFSFTLAPALLIAVCYMLNTNYISQVHPGHTGKFYVLSWLPLGLHFLWGVLEDGKIRHALGLALFVGICMFTSHVQLTYFVLMGFFLIAVGLLWARFNDKTNPENKPDRLKQVGRRFGLFWVGVLLGIGLGAPILLPALNYTSEYSARGDEHHVNYEHATSWSSHPEEVASLLVPEFGGSLDTYWGRNQLKFNSEYPGLTVLVLGILGIVLFRRRVQWVLAAVGVLSIIFALGDHTPFFKLFYAVIPGVKKFRAPSMMLFWLATALVMLTAYFWHYFSAAAGQWNQGRKAAYAKKLFIAAAVLAGVGLVGSVASGALYGMWNGLFSEASSSMRFRPPYGSYEAFLQVQEAAAKGFSAGMLRFGVFGGLLLVGVAQYLRGKWGKPLLFTVMIAVSGVDLLWANLQFIQTIDKDTIFRKIPQYEKLAEQDKSFYRVFDIPGAFSAEKGFHFFYGFKNVTGFYDNELAWYREFHGGSQDYSKYLKGLQMVKPPTNTPGIVRGSKYLDMLRVKYVLAKDNRGRPVYLENESVMPHGYWISNVVLKNKQQALSYMDAPEFDPRREVVVFREDAEKVSGLTDGGNPPEAEMVPAEVRYGNTEIDIDVKAPGKGVLVLSEIYYPHWKVTLDGEEAELLRVNYALRGVVVPEGEHKIRMEFSNPNFKTGWMVFGVSLLALLAMFAVERKLEH